MSFEAKFSALPDGTDLERQPPLDAGRAALWTDRRGFWFHVGLVPALAAGIVHLDGRTVGLLDPERKAFRFARGPCDVEPVPMGGRRVGMLAAARRGGPVR